MASYCGATDRCRWPRAWGRPSPSLSEAPLQLQLRDRNPGVVRARPYVSTQICQRKVTNIHGEVPARGCTMNETLNRVVQVRRFVSPDELEVIGAPVPTASGGEVRIRVPASGVEYTDTLIRQHLYPQTSLRRPPFVMGYDVVGEIDRLGDAVRAARAARARAGSRRCRRSSPARARENGRSGAVGHRARRACGADPRARRQAHRLSTRRFCPRPAGRVRRRLRWYRRGRLPPLVRSAQTRRTAP
jgi:Alcohol dehydrogenase GroES-like domain